MDNVILEAIYRYIEVYLTRNSGLSPTIREIADGCHFNVSTIVRYLDILEAQGRIQRKANTSRSIRLREK